MNDENLDVLMLIALAQTTAALVSIPVVKDDGAMTTRTRLMPPLVVQPPEAIG